VCFFLNKKDDCWQDGIKGSNKGREVVVLPSGKGNGAFWSDHGKAFVVIISCFLTFSDLKELDGRFVSG
jgi:hypothetical protein